jgi:hypothetical protein
MPTVSNRSIVVYTAIAGAYDWLKEPPDHVVQAVDCVAFLDQVSRPSQAGGSAWKIESLPMTDADPCRVAKAPKVLPHLFFPDKRYSLWIDGSVSIEFPFSVAELIERYLAGADLCVFQHRLRNCLYQEAIECSRRHLDDPSLIEAQVQRYRQGGYPAEAGLVEATVLLRRHTPVVNAFDEAWWEEITRGSRRDQISFNYVARQVGLEYNVFGMQLRRKVNNGLFLKHGHHAAILEAAQA